MEKDELQILIDEAKKDLSIETREAIDAVNWKLTILEMAGKYTESQIETLETETELLLCGILTPDEYQKELGTRMMLTGEEVNSLLEEMDKSIFKKIQEELEKRISSKKETSSMQKVESSKEDLISMKEVVSSKENQINTQAVLSSKEKEDEVPKPPYGINSMQPVVSSKEDTNTNIKEQIQVEMPVVPVKPIQEIPKSIFEEKLKGPTASEHTVSDYSTKTDPYREAF